MMMSTINLRAGRGEMKMRVKMTADVEHVAASCQKSEREEGCRCTHSNSTWCKDTRSGNILECALCVIANIHEN